MPTRTYREITPAAIILGIILGGPLEERFIQALTGSDGSLLALFHRPVAAALGVLCLLLWASIPAMALSRRLRRRP